MYKPHVDAKEEFKKLIVETMKDAKNFYANLKYYQFINVVTILDGFMDSYKEDPQFIAKAKQTNIDNQMEQNNLVISKFEGSSVSFSNQQRNYYVSWFKLLVDLATRTIFAGRLTNVDIDLAEVWKDWKQMTSLDEKGVDKTLMQRVKVDAVDIPDGFVSDVEGEEQ